MCDALWQSDLVAQHDNLQVLTKQNAVSSASKPTCAMPSDFAQQSASAIKIMPCRMPQTKTFAAISLWPSPQRLCLGEHWRLHIRSCVDGILDPLFVLVLLLPLLLALHALADRLGKMRITLHKNMTATRTHEHACGPIYSVWNPPCQSAIHILQTTTDLAWPTWQLLARAMRGTLRVDVCSQTYQ